MKLTSKKYSNQEVFDLLHKTKNIYKSASLKKEAALPLTALPLLLGALGAGYAGLPFIGSKSDSIGDKKNSKLSDRIYDFWSRNTTRSNRPDYEYNQYIDELEKNFPINLKGSSNKNAEHLKDLYKDFFNSLSALNANRGQEISSGALQQYQRSLSDIYSFLSSDDIKSDPYLAHWASDLHKRMVGASRQIFTEIKPEIWGARFTNIHNPKEKININSPYIAAENSSRNFYTKKPDIDQLFWEIEEKVKNGELSRKDGESYKRQLIYDKYKSDISGALNLYSSNPSGADKQLERIFERMENDKSGYAPSQDEINNFYAQATREASKRHKDSNMFQKYLVKRYGDLSRFQGKENLEARNELISALKKDFPEINSGIIYNKIYSNIPSKAPNYNDKRYDSFRKALNTDSDFAMGYDRRANKMYYGYGTDKSNWKTLDLSPEEYFSINDANSIKNIDMLKDRFMEAGMTEDEASRAAMGRTKTISMRHPFTGQYGPIRLSGDAFNNKIYESPIAKNLRNKLNQNKKTLS